MKKFIVIITCAVLNFGYIAHAQTADESGQTNNSSNAATAEAYTAESDAQKQKDAEEIRAFEQHQANEYSYHGSEN